MSRTCLSVILVLMVTGASGQFINKLASSTPTQVEKRVASTEYREFYIETPFAKPLIIDDQDLADIRQSVILRVELVYTAYKAESSFDQVALNKDRLARLQSILPELFEIVMIDWRLVEQTGCNSPETCQDFFHGFVLTARPIATEAEMEKEIAFVRKLLRESDPELATDSLIADDEGREPETTDFYSRFSIAETEVVEAPKEDDSGYSGPYYGAGHSAFAARFFWCGERLKRKDSAHVYQVRVQLDSKGKPQAVEVLIENGDEKIAKGIQTELMKMEFKPARKSGKRVESEFKETIVVTQDGIGLPGSRTTVAKRGLFKRLFTPPPLADSSIVKILDRHPEWDDVAILGDLTGSMSPYTVQVLLWHKLNFKADKNRTKHVTFFNDGDRKADAIKRVGKVGGIYSGISDDYEDVEKLAFECMTNGFGGDCPENNIEAAIEAIKKCPECKEFVMIADNFATPRDMRLLPEVKKPIRVIVCGSFGVINPAYLQIARETGGSIHTMEEDLEGLIEAADGSYIEFGGEKYLIDGGEFKPVSRI